MTEVPASEIAEAVTDYADELLPEEAVLKRPTTMPDGGGGRIVSWNVVRTLPCRFEPYGSGTSTRAGGEMPTHPGERLESRIDHIVVFPADADVRLKDRLEINGTTYEINVLRQRGAWELTRRVECKETF